MNSNAEDPLRALRKEYRCGVLDEAMVDASPFAQFRRWFAEVVAAQLVEPNAMVIGTVSAAGLPSTRAVLLKEFTDTAFTFYTNYRSRKASDLTVNPAISALFLWQELERQVRIEGRVKKTSRDASAKYFANRPRKSQISASISPQSSKVNGRPELELAVEKLEKKYAGLDIPLPEAWGGYEITPHYFEFWQGREDRLHDRICYELEGAQWGIFRLAP